MPVVAFTPSWTRLKTHMEVVEVEYVRGNVYSKPTGLHNKLHRFWVLFNPG